MIIKIEKANGSVEIHDVTSMTIISTEMHEIRLGEGNFMVMTQPPIKIDDVICARRTTDAIMG